MKCKGCNRELKNKKSIELGFGPSCYKKYKQKTTDILKWIKES